MASSSNEHSDTERLKLPKFAPNHLLLSSTFIIQTPFASSFPHIFKDLHKSMASATDNFTKMVHSLAAQNPFLKNISSFSSEFHTFCQVHRRNYQNLNSQTKHSFAAILPGDSVAGLVVSNGISNFLSLYNTVLVVRLVLTWFPNAPPAIVGPLSTICDPYLNIFRGIIPPLGGLDLSPILAFLVLNAFTSTAAALPAELPPRGASQESLSAHGSYSNQTKSHQKWRKRLTRNRSSDSPNVN